MTTPNARRRQLMAIIAEELGCPSWIPGTDTEFHYCCDSSRRRCYCERAAKRILDLTDPTCVNVESIDQSEPTP